MCPGCCFCWGLNDISSVLHTEKEVDWKRDSEIVNFHLSRRSRQSSASGYQLVRANESVRLNQEQAESCMNTQRASTAQEEVTGKTGNCPLSRVLGLYWHFERAITEKIWGDRRPTSHSVFFSVHFKLNFSGNQRVALTHFVGSTLWEKEEVLL